MKNVLLVIGLIVAMLGVDAQEINALRIGTIDNSDLNPGDIISVPVYFDEVTQAVTLFQMYITFDQTVLKYVSTKNINASFEEGWRDNLTENFFAVVYIDINRNGKMSDQIGKLFELEFMYNGGETELLFGTVTKVEDNVRVTGETQLMGTNESILPIKLVNGCVCSTE